MQRPLEVVFRGMDHSDWIERRIREKAEGLARFHENITSCRVIVEAPHHHQQQGTIYAIRVDVRIPDGEVVVSRERQKDHAHEDAYVAIRDAFAAVERQLQQYVRRRRGHVKAHDVPPHGKITRIFHDAGYGFAETTDGLEVYFHANSVVGEFAELSVGDEVRLSISEQEADEGPQASSVTAIGKHHLVDRTSA